MSMCYELHGMAIICLLHQYVEPTARRRWSTNPYSISIQHVRAQLDFATYWQP
jgi:hypothetical protein